MRGLARVVLIGLSGSCLGLAWNTFSGRGFPLTRNVLIQPGDQLVEVAEANRRLSRGARFLDARPLDFYEMSHVPGALSLPEDEFDRRFEELAPRLRGSLDVIVYCAGFGCEASHIVARKLKERGVPAAILHEGWPAWIDAGLPVEEGREP